MAQRWSNSTLRAVCLLIAVVTCSKLLPAATQQASPIEQSSAPETNTAPSHLSGQVVDRVIAIVNGDLILESDVDEDRRLSAFQPIRIGAEDNSRAKIIQRLTDRALILQQSKIQPEDAISSAEVDQELLRLRKEIPACQRLHCDTSAGWEAFLTQHGFTEGELHARWRDRMEILRFIEMRFRSGIRNTPLEIRSYYDKTLIPAYAQQKATPPKLSVVSNQISEVLLQQKVSALLDDWLRSLQAQGSVRLLTPEQEVAP